MKAKLFHIKEIEKVLLFDKQVQNIELIKKKAINLDKSKILFNQQKESLSREIQVLQDAMKVMMKQNES